MPVFRIEFHLGSVHLPEFGLWLDAHEPQPAGERVFISHAHSDHIADHREIILSAPTARLMRTRIGGERVEHVLNFREPTRFVFNGNEFQLTLVPAGHVFGSAMSLIESGGERLLYTGDFKLRRGMSAEPCEPVRADVLIMETTFGRPEYVFPPAEAVLKSVARFCREALDNDETPVLLGYSLGKSQELLCGLSDAGLPLMLHGSVYQLTQVYEEFGQCFPKYDRFDSAAAHGKVLLCPPHVINSGMLRNLDKTRTAIVTGWALDPNCRYRYRSDAAFPLSDHADFPELIEFVKRVQPKKVFTLHGFATDFARTLRDLGIDAQALGENEQFDLALGAIAAVPARRVSPLPVDVNNLRVGSEEESVPDDAFQVFAETCAAVARTNGKLEKIQIVSDYLLGLRPQGVALAATWFSGRPFPARENKVLQVGWAVMRGALCAAAGVEEMAVHETYHRHSDLGETAFELLENRHRESLLTLEQVDGVFHQLQSVRGPVAKRPILAAALKSCSALEAKFMVKIITGDLRIGLKEGLLEEAVARTSGTSPNEIRQANLLLGDIGETARLACEGKLNEAALTPFRPIKFMLASPEETARDVWERAQTQRKEDREKVLWIEDKYDGVRCQLHKVGDRVELYSRDLKEITRTFPELADAARRVRGDFILDGEIVAMRGEEVLPFAELQKRLGRREHDLFMRDEVPIRFVAFDLLWLNGRVCLNDPLVHRRGALTQLRMPEGFLLARISDARSTEGIEQAFTAARARGNEGLMIKDAESIYAPGRRGLAWLKYKKALSTLDCVVVGAEYGHGKRNRVLSDYTFAVRDDVTGELKTIGKAYSGLTDAEISELTTHFLETAVRQHGRYFEVKPDTVLEVAFDKIQLSDRHPSGLAMRFPRIVRIRTDKTPNDIDTVAAARRLVGRM